MSTPSDPGPTVRGATSVGAERSNKKRLLVLGAVLLAALIALLLLLSQCGGGDDDPAETSGAAASSTPSTTARSSGSSSGSSSSAGSSTPSASGTAGAGAPAGSGAPSSIVAADGSAVLDPAAPADPTEALGRLSGQAVTGSAVQVLSVPADEGFWVGTSDTQRVWVQLTGTAGESPYQVRQGDRVDFTGTVVAHDPGFAATVGVDDAEGAAQLTAQAQHIEVDRAALALS